MTSVKNSGKGGKDEFLGLFWRLSNPDDAVRISTSEKIVDRVLKSQNKEQKEWLSETKYAIGRLLQGLASERKASRLGFSCALSHLLAKLEVQDDASIQTLLSMADEKLKSSKDKTVEKGVLLGKVFAFLAIIHSCNLGNASSSVKTIFNGLMKLSKMKSYMRTVCLHGICELVKKVPNDIFDEVMWEEVSAMLSKGWDDCDAELFEILQTCHKFHPDTCGKAYLKANNWISQKSKKIELIGPHSYKYLGKMLPGTTNCHPRIHPLCYAVVESVVKSDDIFKKFWKEAVETGLLESSPERKYLAMKLSVHVLPLLSHDRIQTVWSSSLITSLMHIFSNKSNPLHTVSRTEIVNQICEKMRSEKMTSEQQLTLLFQFFKSPAGLFLDDNTNTRCIQAISGSLKVEALRKYITWLKKVFVSGKLNHEGIKEVTLDTARRWSLSQLSQLIRNHRLPRDDNWLISTMQFLFVHYYFVVTPSKTSETPGLEGVDKSFVQITDKTRLHLKHCLEPALNNLNSSPSLQQSDSQKNIVRFHGTASDGEFWISKLIKYANTLMVDFKMKLVEPMEGKSQEIWGEMVGKLEKIFLVEASNPSRISEGTALRLLLTHIGMRLLNCSGEEKNSAHEVLTDLFQVIDERFGDCDEASSGDDQEESEMNWVEVIIETILSMLSQNSRSIRSVADQVFKLLNANLTRKGLHLILDVLDPARSQEILKGDDGLGEEESEDEEEMDEDGDDDDDGGGDDDNDEAEEGSDSDDSAFDDAEISDDIGDENSQFREKVKDALGDAAESSDDEDENAAEGEEEDSDDSGPELDDEAMMRIDSVLSDVFRQKKMTKKKLQEDSRKQLLIFQLRCLDLIEIMAVKRHTHETDGSASDTLILEAVRPLLVTIQHASRTALDMALAEKASVLLRVKICKMKRYPRNLSEDTITRCHDDIEAMMGVAYKAQSVFLCQLASDCCLFILRVLHGNGPKDSGESNLGAVDAARIHKVYKAALDNFMSHRESHLQPCIIQDYIARFPALASALAPDLLKFIKDGVQIYRRSRACFMLYEILKSPAGKEKCNHLMFQITSVANDMIENASATGDVKNKYLAELLRVYYQSLFVMQSTDKLKSLSKPVLTEPLEKFLELEEVRKSQELTNWTKKVLHVLGVEKTPLAATKTKPSKRKKTMSESQNADEASNTEDKSKKVDIEESKDESKKEIKARVLKEKKERKKKRKMNKEKNENGSTGHKGESEESKSKTKTKKKRKKAAESAS